MSSFVISKIEYIKAAGLMFGIETSKRMPFRYFLDSVRNCFNDCYDMNDKSVCEQYGEEYHGGDDRTFDNVFEEYKEKGRMIWSGDSDAPMTRKELRLALLNFFQSVLYQIENEEMNTKVSAFFWRCMERMTDKEVYDVEGWWGRVDI